MAKKAERPIVVKGSLKDAAESGRLQQAIDRRSKYKLAASRRKHGTK